MTLPATPPGPSIRRLLHTLLVGCLALSSPWAGTALAHGATSRGQVLAVDGRPLVGARIELQAVATPWEQAVAHGREDYSPRVVERGRSRTDGGFRLEIPKVGAWRVVVRHPGYLPMARRLDPLGGGGALPPVTLRPRHKALVRLVDAEGRALAGVKLLVAGSGMPPSGGWQGDTRRAVTDADGMARIPFSPGEKVSLAAWHGGQMLYRQIEPDGAGTPSLLVLERCDHPIRLLDADHRPAVAVVVALARPFLALGQSDAEGRLWLPAGLEPAKELVFLDPAGRFARPSGGLPGADGLEEWILRPGIVLTGRVIDGHDGRPLADAWLWSTDGPIRADAGGRFRLRTGDEAPQLTLAAEGYLGRRTRISRHRIHKPLELALVPALELVGRVVDPGGRPLSGVRLELEPEPLGWSSGEWVPEEQEVSDGGESQWAPMELSPAADRRASSHRDGGFRFAPVAPDVAYRLRVERAGFAPLERIVDPLRRGGEPGPLDLVLSPGASLAGRVVDGEGHPVSDARVVLRPEGSDEPVGVDAEGRFEILDLAPGIVHLAVSAPGWAPAAIPSIELRPEAGSVDLGEIVLEPESTLPGRVVDSEGRPVAGARVWARRAGGLAVSTTEHETESDGDGRFEIPGLDASARLHLRVRHPEYQEARLHGVLGAGGPPLEIVLHPGIALRGQVVGGDGAPVVGARVVATPTPAGHVGEHETETDADGRFVLDPQPPGRLALVASHGAGRSRPHELILAFGDTPPEVALTLDQGATMRGRVVGPEGRGVVGARVVAEGRSATQTDADGRFRLVGLGGDRLVLGVDHPEYQPVRQTVEGGAEVAIELAQWRGRRTVSGWVLGPSGQAVGGAEVRLLDASLGPGQVARTTTRHDGAFSVVAPADGHYLVEVAHPGFAPHRGRPFRLAGDDVSSLVVELEYGAAISGNLAGLAPEALRGASILAFAPEHGGQLGRLIGDHYRIPNLPAGTWQVSLHLGTGLQATTGVVSVAPGEEGRLDLAL